MKSILIYLFILLTFSISHSQNKPYGLTERIPNQSLLISSQGDTLAEMDMQRVFENLTFSQPIFLTHARDSTDRIFVVEKEGKIQVFENTYDILSSKIFLNITGRVNSGPSESGLLSMAFHPGYPEIKRFYVYYNTGDLISRISEFKVSEDPNRADINSERIIFEINQPASNHNGGQIAFGQDGYLYIGLGDGGRAGDPWDNAQNPENLLGTIMRIDINATQNGNAYAIPADNPFAGNTDGWEEEIWAWGLRNPWRFSFDRETGALWAGDVGQNAWEEVDLIQKGMNYGWNIMEGFHCYPPETGCDQTDLALPIVEYPHSEGRSITGGYVYRGKRLSRLYGVYLYGDFVTRKIWGLKYENDEIEENKLISECPSSIASFGEDEDGEIYVVGYDGKIYILNEKKENPDIVQIPQSISESGLYSDIDSLTPSPGLIEYTVNSQLWSDGAFKTRFLALSDTSKIIFSKNEHWQFPDNSVVVKNFFLDMKKGNPETRKMIETRFLVKREDSEQWDGYSYLWNDEETDAVLLDSSHTRLFEIQENGKSRQQSYYYPSRSECLACHLPVNGYLLGLTTAQINKDHDYQQNGSIVSDNQLRSYNHIRLFTEDIGEDYLDFPKLPDPNNLNEDIQNRARSYLDANCANCHQPGSSGRSNMDLRFYLDLESANLIDVSPTLDDLGIQDARLVKKGAADSSVIYLRMVDTDQYRMPPIATSVVDSSGLGIIREWIDSMEDETGVYHTATSNTLKEFYLYPVYPNPFNRETVIQYTLPESDRIVLKIYNMLGRELNTLVDKNQSKGLHTIRWNAEELTSGIYIIRMSTESGFNKVQKMILLK